VHQTYHHLFHNELLYQQCPKGIKCSYKSCKLSNKVIATSSFLTGVSKKVSWFVSALTLVMLCNKLSSSCTLYINNLGKRILCWTTSSFYEYYYKHFMLPLDLCNFWCMQVGCPPSWAQ
jgi:hypothetical protein